MKTVVVIQARLQSSRLPGKILLDLGGVTALERCVRRTRRFANVSEVVLATSTLGADDVVASVGKRLGLRVVRGSETDVLSRYLVAARESAADAIVRCTSDCPLLDPKISSEVIRRFLQGAGAIDYAANVLERRLPRGLDTEIFSRDALERAAREATATDEREHVTLRIYRRSDEFRCEAVTFPQLPDLSHLRWTLDTLDDYRLLFTIFERLGARADDADVQEVLSLFEQDPALAQLNANIRQKAT